jgi:hypothetical protein
MPVISEFGRPKKEDSSLRPAGLHSETLFVKRGKDMGRKRETERERVCVYIKEGEREREGEREMERKR